MERELIKPMNWNALPAAVIVGRPNVGKSSLFNRLLGQPQAITARRAGITRDCISAVCHWDEISMLLFDTGGQLEKPQGIDALVRTRAQAVSQRADLIVLVVEYAGVIPSDLEIIERLRKSRAPILCVANKADRHSAADASAELYRLGFKHVVEISAAHGHNITMLKQKMSELLSSKDTHPANSSIDISTAAEHTMANQYAIAIIGRPNCGKSTLANCLAQEEISIVSSTPGTTRDVVAGWYRVPLHTEAPIKILDTAGLRRRAQVKDPIEYYATRRAMRAIRDADICILLIDALEGPTTQDKRIADYATQLGRGLVIGCNKIDLFSTPAQERHLQQSLHRSMPHLSFVPVVMLSALENRGTQNLNRCITALWRQLNRRIPTATLNQMASNMLSNLPGQRLLPRLNYITQSRINPVTFVLFFSHLRGLTATVRTYLANRIREELEFSNLAVLIYLRARRGRGSA